MPIDNFGYVIRGGAQFTRSAQPSRDQDYDDIYNRIDADVVYKLNEERQSPPYGYIKNRFLDASFEASEDAIRAIVSVVEEIDRDIEKGLYVHVHCTYGIDRTGLVVAFYRIMKQGWTPMRALQEMREYGVHKFSEPYHREILIKAFGPITETDQPAPTGRHLVGSELAEASVTGT